MKKLSIILIAVFILFGCANNNEANDQSKNETHNHDASSKIEWHATIEEAVLIANKENRPILVQFSGSDWCKWCIKLNNEVLFTDDFADYAKENLVLVNLDFPRTIPQTDEVKSYNNAQMKKYGVRGFPTVLLMDKDANVVLQTGYQPGGPAAYIEHIKEAYAKK